MGKVLPVETAGDMDGGKPTPALKEGKRRKGRGDYVSSTRSEEGKLSAYWGRGGKGFGC